MSARGFNIGQHVKWKTGSISGIGADNNGEQYGHGLMVYMDVIMFGQHNVAHGLNNLFFFHMPHNIVL